LVAGTRGHDRYDRRGRRHIADLQQTLLKCDQYIPGLGNEDPGDLARKARVSASSTATCVEFARGQVHLEQAHPLGMPRAVMFPRGMHPRLEAVFLHIASERTDPVELTLHVRQSDTPGDFSANKDVATARATLAPGKKGFVEFRVDCNIEGPYVWVWLPPVRGVAWNLMSGSPIGSCRAYGGRAGSEWTVVKGQYYACYMRPALAIPGDFKPENVTCGVTRIVGETPNLWTSDPAQGMPQWIELDFAAPTRLNTVYLTFDTDMNAPFHSVPLVPECVRDYELSCHDGAQWVRLASMTDNFQRRRIHHFEPVTTARLRLTVQATNGSRLARVFQIRAYEE
jgi:hypothetical protein